MNEEMKKRMEELASSYTPEWRFHPKQPDIGTALAMLYGEMLEDTWAKFQNVGERHRRLFYSYLQAKPLEGTRAVGYLACGLSDPDLPEAVVSAGMLLTANNSGGEKQEYRLLEDIYVSGVSIQDFFSQDGNWYLSFDRPPRQGTIQLLFLTLYESRRKKQSYEFFYQMPKGWEEMEIQDETGGFQYSGRVLFTGNPDFMTTEFQGKTGFWLRVVPRQGCALPADLPEVYINCGKVEAVNPGEEGNLAKGAVIKLEKTVGFVTRLSNPDAWYGGAPPETEEDCMLRHGAGICHQFRAVTPKDFERLSFEVCRNLYRSKCYPGYKGSGEKSPGSVTLVALQRDYFMGRRYFYRIREQMEEYLTKRAGVGIGSISVISPWFVWLDIHVKIQADSYQYAMEVKSRTEAVLEEYLNPVTGGNDKGGWPIGTIPGNLQIRHLLSGQPHVLYISQLCVNAWLDKGNDKIAFDPETVSALPFILPMNGNHSIVITVA